MSKDNQTSKQDLVVKEKDVTSPVRDRSIGQQENPMAPPRAMSTITLVDEHGNHICPSSLVKAWRSDFD